MVLIFGLLSALAIMVFWVGQRMLLGHRTLAVLAGGCLLFAFAALALFFGVIMDKVSFDVINGFFVGAGVVVCLSFLGSILLASAILGHYWTKEPAANSKSDPLNRPLEHWQESLPPWLNRLSHTINGVLISFVAASISRNIWRGTAILQPSGNLIAGVYTVVAAYAFALMVYFMVKKLL